MDKRAIISLAAVVVISLAGILSVLFTIESRRGKIPVTIEVSPGSATILVDDKKVSPGRNYLAPGNHTITASHDGYKTEKQSVLIDTENQFIGLALLPESDDAMREANEDHLNRENIGAAAASQRGQILRERYPIVNDLPYFDIAGPFRIEYRFDESNEDHIYVYINYSEPTGRIKALDWIRSKDYQVEDYDIRFADFDNPLKPREGDS